MTWAGEGLLRISAGLSQAHLETSDEKFNAPDLRITDFHILSDIFLHLLTCEIFPHLLTYEIFSHLRIPFFYSLKVGVAPADHRKSEPSAETVRVPRAECG